MYTIRMAARATGLSEDTLRAWERRYGVVCPQRTEAGYRLYDDAAIETLRAMRELVDRGWGPSQAAAQLAGRSTGHPGAPQAPAQPSTPTAPDVPAGPAGPDIESFVAAATALDTHALTRQLDEAFSRASFEQVADRWLMPALDALGRAWAAGQLGVAGEHLAAHCVLRRLSAAYEAAGEQPGGSRVLIGLPPGARHELGVLAFAVAARRVGLRTAYLGADVPREDWLRAARSLGPEGRSAVVLAVPCRRDARAAAAVASELQQASPAVLLAAGGRHQDLLPPPCLQLGHEFGTAAATLAGRLR